MPSGRICHGAGPVPSLETTRREGTIDGLRERRRAHNRAAALDVALALFAERGYEKVTVADICAAAEIAPRTFFRYFPTKEDVLVEPAREMAARVETAIAAAAAGTADEDVLRQAFRELGDHVLAHRRRLAVFVRVLRDAAALRSSPLLLLSERERTLAEHLMRRRPEPTAPDWRTRLLVARAVAAFRIWFDDVLTGDAADPVGHLDELLEHL